MHCTSVRTGGNKATPGVSLVGVCVASYSGLGQTCSTGFCKLVVSCKMQMQSSLTS